MNSSDPQELISEIIADCLRREDVGESVDRQQIITAHPELADELQEYFEAEQRLEILLGSAAIEKSGVGNRDTIFRSADHTIRVPGHNFETLPCQFGRYRILRQLGQGAMGTVYLGHDTQLDRFTAIKIPRLTDETDGEMTARFEREASAAAGLQHRNICPVFDVGEVDGTPYLTMAYVQGSPLSDVLAESKNLSCEQAATIIERLASALQHAHTNGVVHRDLKPANVMLEDESGQPIIMDFGLALRREHTGESRLTAIGALIGSPAYMSPEQINGEPDSVSHSTDIYSLGVMLFEFLTGTVPFSGGTVATIGQILSKEPPQINEFRPDADERLVAICNRMMAKRIDNRFASMQQVAEELQRYLRGTRNDQPAAIECDDESELPDSEIKPQDQSTSAVSSAAPETRIHHGQIETPRGPKWIAAGFTGALGLLLLASIIIYFDGGRIELEDGSQFVVKIGGNGTISISPKDPKDIGHTLTPDTVPATSTSNHAQGPVVRSETATMPVSEGVPNDAKRLEVALDQSESETVTIITLGGCVSLAASHDGNQIATSSNSIPAQISIRDTNSGTLVHRVTMPELQDDAPGQLAFSPDGNTIFFTSGNSCYRVGTNGTKAESIRDFPSRPALVVFPHSPLILALFHEENVHRKQQASVAQRLQIWNWTSNTLVHDERMPIELKTPLGFPAVSPDETLITFSWGHFHVRYPLAVTPNQLSLGKRSVFEKLTRLRAPLVFSANGKYAAASLKSMDYLGALLDVETSRVITFLDPTTAKATNTGDKFRCNYAFTTDSKSLVAADHNGRVAQFRIPSGELIRELGRFVPDHHTLPPRMLVTSQNRVVTAGGYSDPRITIQSLSDERAADGRQQLLDSE